MQLRAEDSSPIFKRVIPPVDSVDVDTDTDTTPTDDSKSAPLDLVTIERKRREDEKEERDKEQETTKQMWDEMSIGEKWEAFEHLDPMTMDSETRAEYIETTNRIQNILLLSGAAHPGKKQRRRQQL